MPPAIKYLLASSISVFLVAVATVILASPPPNLDAVSLAWLLASSFAIVFLAIMAAFLTPMLYRINRMAPLYRKMAYAYAFAVIGVALQVLYNTAYPPAEPFAVAIILLVVLLFSDSVVSFFARKHSNLFLKTALVATPLIGLPITIAGGNLAEGMTAAMRIVSFASIIMATLFLYVKGKRLEPVYLASDFRTYFLEAAWWIALSGALVVIDGMLPYIFPAAAMSEYYLASYAARAVLLILFVNAFYVSFNDFHRIAAGQPTQNPDTAGIKTF